MKPTFFKGVALGAATCFVMLAVTSALAGTGIGDVFNLGQTNSVDATSTLVGATNGGAQLQVTNQGGGAGVRADVGTGRGVVGNHNNATGAPPGVEGNTNSADNGAAGVAGHVLPAGAGTLSAGVRGTNAGSGAGVEALSVKGDGIQATSQGSGRAGVRALHSGPGDGYALYAESNLAAWAGWFGGRVHIDGTTEITGNLAVQGDLTGCENGAVLGTTTIDASSSFPSTYSQVNGFNCAGQSIQARRASTGIYFVRFSGICCHVVVGKGFHALAGNVYDSSEDDFTVIDFRADPLDGRYAFRVSVRDANGGNEDRRFMVIVV